MQAHQRFSKGRLPQPDSPTIPMRLSFFNIKRLHCQPHGGIPPGVEKYFFRFFTSMRFLLSIGISLSPILVNTGNILQYGPLLPL